MKTSLTFIALTLAFVSCKGEIDLKALPKEVTTQTTGGDVVDSTLSFAGISSSTHTDSTMTLNWTAHASAIAYDIYEIISGVPILKQTAIGQSTATATISGLTPGSTYSFRVRIRTSGGKSDSNTVNVTQTMSSTPAAPTLLAKVLPVAASDATGVVKITVSGVKSGDTVKLYSDNTCTTEVASGTAASSSIDLTTTNITLGAHTFAAKVVNSLSTSSVCSTATVSFTRSCPTTYGDFVMVGANTTVGKSANFCVMKYETRNSGGKPYSTGTGAALNAMNFYNARNACESLGSGYKIISNPEWMAIAREIEARGSNWNNGVVGDTYMNRGWTAASWATEGFSNTSTAASSLNNCMYNTAINTCAASGTFELKRTHDLANGEAIWDISGNLLEWVDMSVTCDGSSCAKAYHTADGAPADAFYDLVDLDSNYGGANPINAHSFPPAGPYDRYNNAGTYNARSGNSDTAVVRGGTYNYGVLGGIFAMEFTDPLNAWAQFGFRCTYTP